LLPTSLQTRCKRVANGPTADFNPTDSNGAWQADSQTEQYTNQPPAAVGMPKVKDKVWEEVVVYPKHGAHRVRVRVRVNPNPPWHQGAAKIPDQAP
jgi:hypothetical protein